MISKYLELLVVPSRINKIPLTEIEVFTKQHPNKNILNFLLGTQLLLDTRQIILEYIGTNRETFPKHIPPNHDTCFMVCMHCFMLILR